MSILVVGLDPLLERTLLFETLTINEVNRAGEVRLDASGTGVNCARVLGQFGARVRLLSSCSTEQAGNFAELLQSEGIPVYYTAAGTEPGERTTVVSTSRRGTLRYTSRTGSVRREAAEQLLSAYRDLLPGSRLVVFAGLEWLEAADPFPDAMTQAARDQGIATVLSVGDVERYRRRTSAGKVGPDYIVVHGAAGESPGELTLSMRELSIPGSVPVIWRGDCATVTPGDPGTDTFLEIDPVAVEPLNNSGNYDAFLAGFLLELCEEGSTPGDAIERGHAAAAMNAVQLKPGTIRPE